MRGSILDPMRFFMQISLYASTKRNYILQLLAVFVSFLIFGSMAVSGTMMNLSHFYGLSSTVAPLITLPPFEESRSSALGRCCPQFS
ncbi:MULTISPECIES: hypothetical protein [Paenibacillus]|uniref:hypothetical protein n=1 Tax=Paenibacillus TaxID=44249 RepID=UPI00117E5E08|nr:hypothetical protein [Paenibacillus borealis]